MQRQKEFINLIPSENFTSQAVLEALGSVMQSQLACESNGFRVDIGFYQINIPKDIRVLDIMAAMNSLTRLKLSARKGHWKHLD